MSITALVINSMVVICLFLSLWKSKEKTVLALRVALNAAKRLGPGILALIVIIGIILGFLPPQWIANSIGGERGAIAVLISALLGSVLFMPAIIAFPLAGSLKSMGASPMAIAAFITTLTMIGFIFLPLEIKELGKRFALLRNGLSFVIAILIAIIIGTILG